MLLSVFHLLWIAPLVAHPPPVTLQGGLSYYEDEPSRYTLEYRYEIGDVQWGYDMYIAVADCSYIGHEATVLYEDGREYSAQVFDCSGHDAEPGTAVITSRGIVAELDYASYLAYGLGDAILTLD